MSRDAPAQPRRKIVTSVDCTLRPYLTLPDLLKYCFISLIGEHEVASFRCCCFALAFRPNCLPISSNPYCAGALGQRDIPVIRSHDM